MLFNPFEVVEITPTPVVQVKGDWLYFARKGSIDEQLLPISLQERQRKQAQLSRLLVEAAKNYATVKGVESEVARSAFFPKEVNGIIVAASANPLDYLTSEQGERYMLLAQDSADVPINAETRMIKYRMLHSVLVTEAAKPRTRHLKIKKPWMPLPVGTKLKYGEAIIEVTQPYNPEDGTIDVQPIPVAIEQDAVCFILDANGQYLMGIPEWGEAQTRALSIETADGSISQIQAVYEFYLQESGRAPLPNETDDEPDAEGNDLASQNGKPSLTDSSNQSQSTGMNSTGGASMPESQSQDPSLLELQPA